MTISNSIEEINVDSNSSVTVNQSNSNSTIYIKNDIHITTEPSNKKENGISNKETRDKAEKLAKRLGSSLFGSCGYIVILANLIFDSDIKISFFSDQIPRRIVFGNISRLSDMLQMVYAKDPNLNEVFTILSNTTSLIYSFAILKEFLKTCVQKGYSCEFEFIMKN